MAWIRDGESPEHIKVSFVISVKEHPELARFIWSLPYRGASRTLRDILSSAVKAAGGADMLKNDLRDPVPALDKRETPRQPVRDAGQQPAIDDVSAAAAGIIGNFDKMFPS